MTKQDIERLAEITAIKNLLSMLMAAQFVAHGYTDDQIKQLNEGILKKSASETFEGIDPALSDHVSAEIEAATASILDLVREKVAALRRR